MAFSIINHRIEIIRLLQSYVFEIENHCCVIQNTVSDCVALIDNDSSILKASEELKLLTSSIEVDIEEIKKIIQWLEDEEVRLTPPQPPIL